MDKILTEKDISDLIFDDKTTRSLLRKLGDIAGASSYCNYENATIVGFPTQDKAKLGIAIFKKNKFKAGWSGLNRLTREWELYVPGW